MPATIDVPVARILVIRPNHRLGNQLLLTPLLQEIEKLYPAAKY
jgi:heptosyltransferase-3